MLSRWIILSSVFPLSLSSSAGEIFDTHTHTGIERKARVRTVRKLSTLEESNSSPQPSTSIAPSMSPPSSSPVPELRRTVSSSPSNSIAASSTSDPSGSIHGDARSKPNFKHSWSLLLPVLSMTILAWAAKANARVRQHAAACCTGDLCGTDDGEMIPDEIVIQTKPSGVDSVVGNSTRDIELMPVSTFEDASVVGIAVRNRTGSAPWWEPHQIRRTRWNDVPDDPVDEVSLKGSSFYCSSDDDDDREKPKTSFVRMKSVR